MSDMSAKAHMWSHYALVLTYAGRQVVALRIAVAVVSTSLICHVDRRNAGKTRARVSVDEQLGEFANDTRWWKRAMTKNVGGVVMGRERGENCRCLWWWKQRLRCPAVQGSGKRSLRRGVVRAVHATNVPSSSSLL